MWALFILIGVALTILNYNEILLIPSLVEYIVYGVGAFLLVIKIVIAFIAANTTRKITKRF